jgi:hypothetical protein
MSLDVSPALLEQAHNGNVSDEDFIACVKSSLPFAWQMISGLVDRAKGTGAPFADNQTPPPDDRAQRQLLSALASTAMRGALERHFGVRIAFQNCHRVGVFTPAASEDDYRQFVSTRAQLLNQSPELVNC